MKPEVFLDASYAMNPRLAAAALFPAIFIAGALLAWWMAVQTDRRMRTDLLQQAQMVAQAVEPARIQALSGTAADLNTPGYLRLKEQLTTVRSAYPQCRFIYLMGRRANLPVAKGQPASGSLSAGAAQADNAVFFFVDSEPSGSKDYSPPGQIYAEVPEGYRRVFASRTAAVAGPVTDRWGAWVTSLVPIHDPQTAMYGLATPDDARAVVRRAVDFYKKNGRERLLKEINNPHGEFRKGDLYAFAYDRGLTMLAHPVKPELVGLNLLDVKDVPGGKYFRREIQQTALTNGSGWVDYEYENPANRQIEPKTTYVEGVDDLIVCAGAYKGTGAILAVLGMDVDKRDWNRMRIRAVLPPVLLTLAVAALLSMGALLLTRRSRLALAAPHGLRHVETGTAVAIGLVLTLFASWMAHTAESRSRGEAFEAFAANRTARVAERLRDIRGTELEGLASYYAGSEHVTHAEFLQYTEYLTKNPAVFAWQWAPAVLAADRMRFEAEARAEGLPGFEIWQKDSQGKAMPASGRAVYYPVFQVAPRAGNERALGYDLGSEPRRRAALEEAMRTSLPTATDPVSLVQETGSQKGMLVYRPVSGGNGPGHPRGFALAVLRMETLLQSGLSDNAVMELSLLHKDAAPEPLAATWDADSPPAAGLCSTRPVLAFGKVFAVTAHAGPDFMRMHPVQAGWLAILIGMALTAAIAAVIHLTLRRREELEQLVAERTLELRESEQSYHNQFAYNSAVMLLMDPEDGAIIDANAAALRFYGYPREVLLTMRITDINTLPASEVRRAMASVPDRQGKQFQFQHRLADGSVRDVEASTSRIQFARRIVLHAIIQDITERKQLEAALEKRFLALIRPMDQPEGITFEELFDLATIQRIQDEFAAATGVASIITQPDGTPITRPSNFCRLCESIIRCTETGRLNCYRSDALLGRHHPDGPIIQPCLSGGLWDAGASITVGNRHIANWLIGQVRDETQSEEKMREYARTIKADEAAVIAAFHEVPSMSLARFQQIAQALFTLANQLSTTAYQNVQQARFINERKQAEEERARIEGQLRQAQKMESVGRLAGGVAHDFNNMLGAILGHAELAIAQVDPSQKVFSNLRQIRKAALRSADLTRQLLAFARKQTVAPKVLDLNETVGGMLNMLERLIGEDIDLNWLPKADLWPVKVDPSQIDQVLANLCVNARDAIADVGRISIETGNSTFGADYCADHAGVAPGDYVMLAVSDTGCGLDRETLAHIFEPFFTTKEEGKGTGLGLAMVYGIVKQNNGFINVYSEPDQGTTFTIYLPRHAGTPPRMRKEAPEAPAVRGHETVLLVEDEPTLLEMITMMLEMQGYAVVAANAPDEAIRLAGECAGGIHLLMTDVVMPGMNGRDLAQNLLSRYPHLKCLFMSGYTANVIAHHGVLDEGVYFIQKPFSATELSAKVREALSE